MNVVQHEVADSCGGFADSSADSWIASSTLTRIVRIVFFNSYIRAHAHARAYKSFLQKPSEVSANATRTTSNYPQNYPHNYPQLSARGRV